MHPKAFERLFDSRDLLIYCPVIIYFIASTSFFVYWLVPIKFDIEK